MSEDPKLIVQQAYDRIADWYLDWVDGQHSPRERFTKKVLDASPPFPRILELGCGPGVPITRMLLDNGAQVVANDISEKQISMAKQRCPQATYILGDMATLSFEAASFDGVTCFFTLFHLPRKEQRTMLASIHLWLKPGGIFAVNLATIDEEEIFGEMMGNGMFWSSYSTAQSRAMLADVGFTILEEEEVESGDGKLEEDDADYGVKFVWIAARK